jgi:localization factor PodJL
MTNPWSVTGIDPETREAAKLAARRAGLSVGTWLTQVIRAAAVQQLKGAGGPAAAPDPAADNPRPGTVPASGSAPVPAPTMQALLENIQKLAARIDQAETRAGEALAPLADRIKDLSSSLDDVKKRPNVTVAPVERAITRLAERLDKIERDREEPRPARRGLFGLWRG